MPLLVGLANVPVELLVHIFSFACTDAGHTGCALKLVCRAFYDLCVQTSLDIQFAAVCGKRSINAFLAILKGRVLRRVESLFLCEQDARAYDLNVSALRQMEEILVTISSTHLQILTVEYCSAVSSFGVHSLIPTRFPSLRELSISGPFYETAFQRTCMHALPRLTHLHIKKYRKLPTDFGPALARICPNLTHLRIMHVAYNRPDGGPLPQFVRGYIRSEDPDDVVPLAVNPTTSRKYKGKDKGKDKVIPPTIPPCLHRVIIDFLPLPPMLSRPGTIQLTAIAHLQMFRRFAETTRTAMVGGKRDLVVLQAPLNMFGLMENQWIPDFSEGKWMERSVGMGKGCWV